MAEHETRQTGEDASDPESFSYVGPKEPDRKPAPKKPKPKE